MFPHPVRPFWTHLEGPKCHIVQKPIFDRFYDFLEKQFLSSHEMSQGALSHRAQGPGLGPGPGWQGREAGSAEAASAESKALGLDTLLAPSRGQITLPGTPLFETSNFSDPFEIEIEINY